MKFYHTKVKKSTAKIIIILLFCFFVNIGDRSRLEFICVKKKGNKKMETKENKQSKIILSLLSVLLITLIFAAVPTEAEGAIYGDTLRLHILASSDSEEDQALKLEIRDKILEKYGEALSTLKSMDDAVGMMTALADDIKEDVDRWIYEAGFSYSSRVEIGREWYETREYSDFSLPCGYYTSVRVLLGEGEGKNWWCVMYPPLCLDIATESNTSYTESEEKLIQAGEYNIKFKLLEVLSKSFSDLDKKG